MNEKPQTAVQIRTIRHKKARVEHHFMANGVVQRFVVLEDKRMRETLNQPRRTQIDSIGLSSGDEAMTRGDHWERAECLANALLRELFRQAGEARAAHRANASARKRESRKRGLGREIIPSATTEDAVGTLLYAGTRSGVPYCIELLSADGKLQRIEGIDLPRALDVAGAGVGEVIRVTKVAAHRVGIVEQRTGSHGTGRRTRRRTRVVFLIAKETSQERAARDPDYGGDSRTGSHMDELFYPARHAPRDVANR